MTFRRDRAGTPITSGAAVPAGAGTYEDQIFTYDVRTSGAAVTQTDSRNSATTDSTTTTINDELDVTQRTGDGLHLPNVANEVFQRDPAGRVTQVSRLISTFMNGKAGVRKEADES